MSNTIASGGICPYCENPSEYLQTSESVYGRDYGPLWACLACEAWVGCHRGTDVALGRLANAELRKYKSICHGEFDPLWKEAVRRGRKKYEARNAGYQWLADEMGISREECHFGLFDIEQCKTALNIIIKWKYKK